MVSRENRLRARDYDTVFRPLSVKRAPDQLTLQRIVTAQRSIRGGAAKPDGPAATVRFYFRFVYPSSDRFRCVAIFHAGSPLCS